MHATAATTSIYERLGVQPVINARGNNTVLGGSTPSPRVRQAMLDAERYYVDMQQLLERSGEAIARLLGAEAAYVTPGAAAALALGAAACMTGTDNARIAQLPDVSGLKHRILIQAGHHYHYEHAVTVPGAHLDEVGSQGRTTAQELESALDSSVVAVLVPAHLDGAPGTVSLAEVREIARARQVPVLVDAAGRVYPVEKLRAYAREGGDLVAFGAKYLGALNASGILCGRADLVAAAACNSFMGFETVNWGATFGRPLKLDRQTIVAVVAALEEWLETDHEARLAGYQRRLERMASALEGAPGVSTRIVHDEGPSPRVLVISPGAGARLDAAGLVQQLRDGQPAIAVVRNASESISINPVTVREEDDAAMIDRLRELLL